MNTLDIIKNRQSVRAFLDKPVSRDQIIKILEAARYAPSGTNTQPWEVAVVVGEIKDQLGNAMVEAFRTRGKGQPDYNYYPQEWKPVFKSRRVACGMQLYETLGIKRDDLKRRQSQWEANYLSFGAPVVMYFLMDKSLETGSFMDYGMFIQNIMIAAVAEGLATCPQAALAEYPDIVKAQLGYDDEMLVVCGLALGYEDPEAPINSYRTPREPVEKFAQFFE